MRPLERFGRPALREQPPSPPGVRSGIVRIEIEGAAVTCFGVGPLPSAKGDLAKHKVRFGNCGVQLQGSSRGLCRLRQRVNGLVSAERGAQDRVGGSKAGVRRCEGRILCDRRLEIPHTRLEIRRRRSVQRKAALQVVFIDVGRHCEPIGRIPGAGLSTGNRDLNLARNRLCHLGHRR